MARIDDSPRVFDVSKPYKHGPPGTSRPVIVGHRPMMHDPMVKDEDEHLLQPHSKKVTSVPVLTDDSDNLHHKADEPTEEMSEPHKITETHADRVVAKHDEPEPDKATERHEHHKHDEMSLDIESHESEDKKPEHGHQHIDNLDWPKDDDAESEKTFPLPHPKGAGPKRSLRKYAATVLSVIVLVGAGLYLAVDSGAINTNLNLPFHIFKQKAPQVATNSPTPSASKPVAAAAAVPVGFTLYKLEGTSISFVYPIVWGTPSVTVEPGFTQRGAGSKSDGTYAHLINFAQNKDVQLAFTSSNFLPGARAAQYYDFLQWCVGTHDGKFYKTILRFVTVNKVDTATTMTCDQGPLADASKSDENTLVQLKTKGPDGKDLGDLYTKNLFNPNLPVVRAKDASAANGENIKKLLASIKSATTSTP